MLPGLWSSPELVLRDMYTYFSSNPTVQIQREKFSDEIVIPKVERSVVDAAIQMAVKERRLWLLAGRASLYAEDVPADVLNEEATLQAPPQPLHAKEVMPDALPEAWNGSDETTALAVSEALATKLGKVLPWILIRDAIDGAFKARWLERTTDSGSLSDYAGARAVKICVRKETVTPLPTKPTVADAPPIYDSPRETETPTTFVAEAVLAGNELQDLSEVTADIMKAAVDAGITFKMRIELGTKAVPSTETVDQINKLLQEVSKHLRLV